MLNERPKIRRHHQEFHVMQVSQIAQRQGSGYISIVCSGLHCYEQRRRGNHPTDQLPQEK